MPGRLENLNKASVRFADGSLLAVEVESAWAHKDFWVLKFSGIDSIEAAEQFRGSELCVPAEERGKLPEGEYFRSDLLGCELIERSSGRRVGRLAGWQQYGGPPLMEVQSHGREVLIPFVRGICREVDVAGKTIIVDLPEGLLEL